MADLSHTTIGIGAAPNDGNGTPARTAASTTLNPELAKLLSALIYDDTTDEVRAVGTFRKNGTHPAVTARPTNTATNETGDGTVFTLIWDTEIFDQGGDLSGTTFTAPVTGKYLFCVNIRVNVLDAAHTLVLTSLVTSNRTYALTTNSGVNRDASNRVSANSSVIADMDAGDTATVTLTVANSTKTVGVTTSTDNRTVLSIALEA